MNTNVRGETSADDPSESRPNLPLYNAAVVLDSVISRIYPDGLQGRSALDCACNSGANLFYLKGVGAGECFGFDVREHWINQATWLRENCTTVPTEKMRFEVCDLYDLPRKNLQAFDVCLFNGIFYHLPDPVAGLKIAADLTRELMVVSTATYTHAEDGFLAVGTESTEDLLSGVYGLHWRPTGPAVLDRIFRWAGFCETSVVRWVREAGPPSPPRWGRLTMAASRTPGLLAGIQFVSQP